MKYVELTIMEMAMREVSHRAADRYIKFMELHAQSVIIFLCLRLPFFRIWYKQRNVATMLMDQAPAGKRILYVDDEEGLALLGEEFLGDLGYQVTSVFDGRLALTQFERADQVFDLVVSDESMPCMSGIELAQKIYRISPETPVILCSGHLLTMEETGMEQTNIVAVLLKTDVCTTLPTLLEQYL